ncbi:MAG: class I SAM-dependent methyltransferase [Ruminococcaceae bacterium]|nr:class I SAM-dependent methyltransferase [Oscillospiraceae bacterium]
MDTKETAQGCEIAGDICRPGGFELTQRLIGLGALPAGAAVLDVGCGSGATVAWLIHQGYGGSAGVDVALPADVQPPLYHAGAQALPFTGPQFNAILCECSFSLVAQATVALAQFAGLLKPGGCLLFSDLYSRTETARLSGEGGKLYTRQALQQLLESNGFTVTHFEDQSDALKQLAIQRILNDGADALYAGLGTSFEEMKRIRPGYYLLVARKANGAGA